MKLAVKYSEEEQFSLPNLKKEFSPVIDFAYDEVRKKSQPEQELILFIKCLPLPSQKIKYFKMKKLTQEALEFMVSEKMYSNAYRYARAQQMYSEGIKLASELNDKRMISEIILDKAVSDIYDSKNICTDDLKEIAKTTHSEVGAKACLLLAKFEFGTTNTVDAEKDCFRSFELYQKFKNKVGQTETFNLLIQVLKVKGEIKSNIPCLTVEAVDRINEIEKTIEKSSKSPSLIYNLNTILKFYGIEPKGKYYHMACDQDIWIKKLRSENCDEIIKETGSNSQSATPKCF